MNKKAFEMNFAWIFAIIAGVVILFLAIYGASQFIKTRRYEIDMQTAAKLAILLDPLETSLEAGKSVLVSFNSETRLYNKCENYGNFGGQKIGVAGKSGAGKDWQEPGYSKLQYNKYIFSGDIEEGREFSVFSKPLKMPFKVSDLIFFSGQEYCFIQAPTEIKDELQGLNIRNMYFTDIKGNCSENSKTVCFSGSGCDITVYGDNYEFDSGYVAKEGKTMHYVGSLIYGALFSSPKVYECQVKRLMLRLANLCLVYKDKIEVLESEGCSSTLDSHFAEMINLARNLNSSQDLLLVQEKSQNIEKINNAAVCGVF